MKVTLDATKELVCLHIYQDLKLFNILLAVVCELLIVLVPYLSSVSIGNQVHAAQFPSVSLFKKYENAAIVLHKSISLSCDIFPALDSTFTKIHQWW